MKLLLDTHIFLRLINESAVALPRHIEVLLRSRSDEFYLSVASLWEIAIKHRLGKLPLSVPLGALPAFALNLQISDLGIAVDHVLAVLDPGPPTRDPFDRLLLAQCKIENMRLVTIDRALLGHPLALDAY